MKKPSLSEGASQTAAVDVAEASAATISTACSAGANPGSPKHTSTLAREDLSLFVVADGIAVAEASSVVATLVTKSVENYFEATEHLVPKQYDSFGLLTQARRLSASVHKANADLLEISRNYANPQRMHASVCVVHLRPEWHQLYVAHLGNCRCYRMRRGVLEQLTRDHVLRDDVVQLRPEVSSDVLEHLPLNIVTRALGMMQRVRVQVSTFELMAEDRYLVCCQGLATAVDTGELRSYLWMDQSASQIAKQLVLLAKERVPDTDASAVVIDFVPGERCNFASEDGWQAATADSAADSEADAVSWNDESVHRGRGQSSEVVVSDSWAATASRLALQPASFPDILLQGIESRLTGDPTDQFHALPSVADNDRDVSGIRQAVEQFVETLRPAPYPVPVEPIPDDRSRSRPCSACEYPLPWEARFCPHCGTPRRV